MPIIALPAGAVSAIGSTQVLTDSASVVKELIDNALDAQASAISIDISANTIDTLQVKDNGYGIAPEDRDLLCRRHSTSKITNLQDLENIGGASLGFRGEALASAAEMSETIAITTRIESEGVAMHMKFGRQGDCESKAAVSHPVGTTVRITGFLKGLPVRRQTALKSSGTAALTRVKRILKAYAIARPSIRFSLKVLKAKNEKDNWAYVSKRDSSVSDAVAKVVDTRMVSQCQWIVYTTSNSQPQYPVIAESRTREDAYTFEAFLPKPSCELPVINNMGQYVSVDSRPVSCTRGVLKQVTSLFKNHLRSAASCSDGEKLVDPFMALNIVCPAHSYDANIEPAKDDLLFTNADHLLECTETFFKSVYGDFRSIDKIKPSETHSRSRQQGFEILLAGKSQAVKYVGNTETTLTDRPTHQTHNQGAVRAVGDEQGLGEISNGASASNNAQAFSNDIQFSITEEHASKSKGAWKNSMCGDDEISPHSQSIKRTINTEEGLQNSPVLNPWTIAALNAPLRLRKPKVQDAKRNEQLLTPAKQPGDISDGYDDMMPTELRNHNIIERQQPIRQESSPSADQSSPSSHSFPFPLRAWGKGERDPVVKKQTTAENASRSLLPWIQRPSNHNATNAEDLYQRDAGLDNERRGPGNGFVPARTLLLGTPLHSIPDKSSAQTRKSIFRNQGNTTKPFVSPVNDPARVWFDIGSSGRTKTTLQSRSAKDGYEGTSSSFSIPSESEDMVRIMDQNSKKLSVNQVKPIHPDLAVTLDYEKRKQEAIQQRREHLRNQAISTKQIRDIFDSKDASVDHSPHRNRYNAATAALSPLNPLSGKETVALQYDDPRAYLLRMQQWEKDDRQNGPARNSFKPRRRKTSMLPLETIPEDESVQKLALTIKSEISHIRQLATALSTQDEYIQARELPASLASASIDDTKQLEIKVSFMVQSCFVTESGMAAEIPVELRLPLQNHFADDL